MFSKLKLWWREWSWIIYLAVFVLSLVLIAIKSDERVFMYMIGDIIPTESEIKDVGAGKITRYHKVIGYSVGDVCIEDGKLEADIKYETETLENIGLNFTINGDKYYEH